MSRKSSSKIPASTPSSKADSGGAPKSGEKIVSKSKFELIAELGRGGMATVYLARAQRRPEKLIVLKQLRSDLAENADFLAMFLEEARLAGKLTHPNIVETFEVGKDDDKYYIAMEYLDGLSLQAVLSKYGWKGPFSFALHVFVLIEALRALEQAYTQRDDDGTPMRIVHRDVSPPNIILTFDGQVKLVDFGIAKAANSTIETRTGLIKGKLTYMAPEQAASGDVDSRTDIYSVGVMLWQAAAGKRRWKGIDNREVLKRLHAGRVADSPNAGANALPAIIDDIVLKAIAAEPEDRYASAGEMRVALERLLKKMDVGVTAADLAGFMSEQFAGERKRADEVLASRLAELDGVSRTSANESVTAVRSSPQRSPLPEKPKGVASPRPQQMTNPGSKGGDGAHAVERRKTGRIVSHESSDSSVSELSHPPFAKLPHASARRSYAIPIGIVGISLAALLAYLAIHRSHLSTPTAPPNIAAPSSPGAAASVPPAPAIAVELQPSFPPTISATPNVSLPNSPRGSSKRHGHIPTQPAVGAPTAAPSPPVIPAALQKTPAQPVRPAAAETTSQNPSLDKQDPWQQKSPVDKGDPWAN